MQGAGTGTAMEGLPHDIFPEGERGARAFSRLPPNAFPMKRRRFLHRRFDHRMDRLQGAADLFDEQLEKAREHVSAAADHAREGLHRGRKAVVTLEQNIVQAVRENPVLFILAAVSLVGLLLAGLWMARRHRERF